MSVAVSAHRPDPFALTPEERQIRDTVRDFAQRELAPTVAQRDEEERYDRSLFERMASLGRVIIYTFLLVRTAGAMALLAAPVLPMTGIGVADHFAERRAPAPPQ